uniref:Uncharacterized protein n=1 Tax=Anopheles coluzzii TaxID=1518534 RepID=A0A8W7PH17_ANOCL
MKTVYPWKLQILVRRRAQMVMMVMVMVMMVVMKMLVLRGVALPVAIVMRHADDAPAMTHTERWRFCCADSRLSVLSMARSRFFRLVVERMSTWGIIKVHNIKVLSIWLSSTDVKPTLSLSFSGKIAMIHQAHAGPSVTSSQFSSRSGILPKLLKISHRMLSGRLWCHSIAFSSTFSCRSRTSCSRSSASVLPPCIFSSSKNSTCAVSYPSRSWRVSTRNRRPPTVERMEHPSPSCTQSRMSSIVPYSTYRWRPFWAGRAMPNRRSPLSIARRTINR